MIKAIHTADWHLGQTFFGYDRESEHRIFLDSLRRTVSEHNADLLIVAGDVFDTPNPSSSAQKLFFEFLLSVTRDNPNLEVVITAGNHDSGMRLEAPSSLLECFKVHVVGTVRHLDDGTTDYERHIIPIERDGKPVCLVLAVPYLRSGDYPEAATYGEGVGAFYASVLATAKEKFGDKIPIIATGHLQTAGAALNDGDRSERIIVGGLEAVPSSVFDKSLSYVALGHLHKAQRASAARENVRYSGSPLPMSFAERDSVKSICLVEIPESKDNFTETKTTAIETPDPVRLVRVEGDTRHLDELLERLASFEEGKADELSPFVEVTVGIFAPEPMLRAIIERALEGRKARLTRIEAVIAKTEEKDNEENGIQDNGSVDLRRMTPMNIALDTFKRKYNHSMPESMKKILLEIIAQSQKTEQEREA